MRRTGLALAATALLMVELAGAALASRVPELEAQDRGPGGAEGVPQGAGNGAGRGAGDMVPAKQEDPALAETGYDSQRNRWRRVPPLFDTIVS